MSWYCARMARIWSCLFVRKICRQYMESHGDDIRYKIKFDINDMEMRLCMEQYGVVAKYLKQGIWWLIPTIPNDHTRWKHKFGWHNRGCVWDKIASEWRVKQDWHNKRKTSEGRGQETSWCLRCWVWNTQSYTGQKIGECVKSNCKKKETRILGPRDESMSIRIEDVTAQKCGDSKVAEKWINGHCTMGQKHKAKIDHIQKTLYSRWTRRVVYPTERIDDYTKHVSREYNQEDGHLTIHDADG